MEPIKPNPKQEPKKQQQPASPTEQAGVYFAQGNSLKAQGRLEEAVLCYERSAALMPNDAVVLYNLGNTLDDLHRRPEALVNLDRVIALRPDVAEVHNNRGIVLRELGRLEEALASYDRAVALRPDYAAVYHNRGIVLQDLGRLEDALASYDRMIALRPDFPASHFNRGNVLKDLLRPEDAIQSYNRVIELVPEHAMSHKNKSLLQLLLGNYREGWPLYEWRWKNELQDQARNFTQPLWLGDVPLAGRTLLIHAEQGLGDVLQFCRYIALAEAQGAKVILEAPSSLMPILATLHGNCTFVEKGNALPDFDLQCPVMSLPLAFKTTLETIPAEIPYLFADPIKRYAWRKKLGDVPRPKIGLVWSGGGEHSNDHRRSVALENLNPLLNLPFEFHSLQTEYRRGENAWLGSLPRLRDHQNELKDFSDTAALVAEMDLVLSVDTSVAHLAGAMGKPVWILLPHLPDFRWLLDRVDSPWYPTARLFRQPAIDDWGSVFAKVTEAVRQKF
jgi:hypothetical protein